MQICGLDLGQCAIARHHELGQLDEYDCPRAVERVRLHGTGRVLNSMLNSIGFGSGSVCYGGNAEPRDCSWGLDGVPITPVVPYSCPGCIAVAVDHVDSGRGNHVDSLARLTDIDEQATENRLLTFLQPRFTSQGGSDRAHPRRERSPQVTDRTVADSPPPRACPPFLD
jgi:hypothetical protein